MDTFNSILGYFGIQLAHAEDEGGGSDDGGGDGSSDSDSGDSDRGDSSDDDSDDSDTSDSDSQNNDDTPTEDDEADEPTTTTTGNVLLSADEENNAETTGTTPLGTNQPNTQPPVDGIDKNILAPPKGIDNKIIYSLPDKNIPPKDWQKKAKEVWYGMGNTARVGITAKTADGRL